MVNIDTYLCDFPTCFSAKQNDNVLQMGSLLPNWAPVMTFNVNKINSYLSIIDDNNSNKNISKEN